MFTVTTAKETIKHSLSRRFFLSLSFILPYFSYAPGIVVTVLSAVTGALITATTSQLPGQRLGTLGALPELGYLPKKCYLQDRDTFRWKIRRTSPRYPHQELNSGQSSNLSLFLDHNTFFGEAYPNKITLQKATERKFLLFHGNYHGSAGAVGANNDQLDCLQMRLRPGYATKWRIWRAAYAIQSSFHFFRQKRWTTHFQRARVSAGLPLLWATTLSVSACLFRAYPLYGTAVLSQLLTQHKIYIRGHRTVHALTQIYVGDTLWVRGIIGCGRHTAHGLQHIPNYLEIDYLGGAITLLCLPPVFNEDLGLLFCEVPLFAIRLYNWKYIA